MGGLSGAKDGPHPAQPLSCPSRGTSLPAILPAVAFWRGRMGGLSGAKDGPHPAQPLSCPSRGTSLPAILSAVALAKAEALAKAGLSPSTLLRAVSLSNGRRGARVRCR